MNLRAAICLVLGLSFLILSSCKPFGTGSARVNLIIGMVWMAAGVVSLKSKP